MWAKQKQDLGFGLDMPVPQSIATIPFNWDAQDILDAKTESKLLISSHPAYPEYPCK